MKRNIPSIQSLICFESAAKHSSYTHAAQELFMTQGAVSRQVQQLEYLLGVDLFIRTRYGVELTEAGKNYLTAIKPHLLGLEKSTSEMIVHKGAGGTLKLGVVPTFATRWLLPKLFDFNLLYPEIMVKLETSTKPFLFSNHVFDAAIFAGTQEQVEHWPDTTAHCLMKEDMVAVCSPRLIARLFPKALPNAHGQYELTPQQLLSLPLIQQTTRPTIWQEWFEAHNIYHPNPFIGQCYELFSMIAVATSRETGIALIPQMLIEAELTKKTLVTISSQKFNSNRSYYIVHSGREQSLIVNKFIDWLKPYCPSA